MAGIGAIVYPSIFDSGKIKDHLLPILEHRGKGQKEIYRYRNLEMGSLGGNIAHNEKRNIFALLDGHIYNDSEIKDQIRKSGYQWKDKEVSHEKLIVLAYELWGISFIEKLNGDFSIALFDQRIKRFYVIRDRLGKKPLYWAKSSQYFVFSNELKALLSSGIIPQTPSKDGLAAYLFMGYIPQDLTLIKGVNKLLPGFYLQLDLEEKSDKFSVHSYWSLSQFFRNKKNAEDSVEEFEHLLKDAIKIRSIENENSSCILDGSESAQSLAFFLKEQNNVQDSYFAGLGDQLKQAHASADKLSLNFLDCSNDNIFKDLVTLVWFLDEPVGDFAVKDTWELCKQVSKHQQSIFSAIAAENLLNRSPTKKPQESFLSKIYYSAGLKLLPLLRKLSPQLAYSFLRNHHSRKDQVRYLQEQTNLSSREMKYYFPSLFAAFQDQIFLQKFYKISEIEAGIPSCVYFDLKTTLPDKILIQFERFSSLHHLRWISPFLDHRVVEFLVGIEQKQNSTYLETLMKERLKFEGKRKIQPIPRTKNMRALASIAKDLESGVIVESGFISQRKIQQLIKAKPDYTFSLLILEIWLRLFISKPVNSLKESLFGDSFLAKIFSLS